MSSRELQELANSRSKLLHAVQAQKSMEAEYLQGNQLNQVRMEKLVKEHHRGRNFVQDVDDFNLGTSPTRDDFLWQQNLLRFQSERGAQDEFRNLRFSSTSQTQLLGKSKQSPTIKRDKNAQKRVKSKNNFFLHLKKEKAPATTDFEVDISTDPLKNIFDHTNQDIFEERDTVEEGVDDRSAQMADGLQSGTRKQNLQRGAEESGQGSQELANFKSRSRSQKSRKSQYGGESQVARPIQSQNAINRLRKNRSSSRTSAQGNRQLFRPQKNNLNFEAMNLSYDFSQDYNRTQHEQEPHNDVRSSQLLPHIANFAEEGQHLHALNENRGMQSEARLWSGTGLPQVDLTAAAGQQLFEMNRNSTQDLQSVQRLISQDKNSKNISELLIQSAAKPDSAVREYRMKMQAKVYTQNLSKMVGGRSVHSAVRDLAPDRNFILKNKKRVQNGEAASQAISKLERIKKLQLQTQQLMSDNKQMKKTNEIEDFLHQSIDQIVNDTTQTRKKFTMPNRKSDIKALEPTSGRQSDKTSEQFKNLKQQSPENGKKLRTRTKSQTQYMKARAQSQQKIKTAPQRDDVIGSLKNHQLPRQESYDLQQFRQALPGQASSAVRTPKHRGQKQRSQTAHHSAAGRPNTVGRLGARKQQSALGTNKLPHISRGITNQRQPSRPSHETLANLTQKPRAVSGGGAQGHGSQATTKKFEFGAQNLAFDENEKLGDIQSQYYSNNNLDFEGSIPELQSHGDFKEKEGNQALSKGGNNDKLQGKLEKVTEGSINIEVQPAGSNRKPRNTKERELQGSQKKRDVSFRNPISKSSNYQEALSNNAPPGAIKATEETERSPPKSEMPTSAGEKVKFTSQHEVASPQLRKILTSDAGPVPIDEDHNYQTQENTHRQQDMMAASQTKLRTSYHVSMQSRQLPVRFCRRLQSNKSHDNLRKGMTRMRSQPPAAGRVASHSNERRGSGGFGVNSSQDSMDGRSTSQMQIRRYEARAGAQNDEYANTTNNGQILEDLWTGPILDELGHTIYEAKHRKPKWVLQTEYQRFQRNEDQTLSQCNSRNNRIRMEDPFIRRPDDKYVFTHIQDFEIAKYMVAVAYLEKDVLSYREEIGVHPYISSFQLLVDEMIQTVGDPKIEYTTRLNRQQIQELEFEFSVFGHKNPNEDLKKDFVLDHRKDPVDIDFVTSFKKRERKELLNFVMLEDFGETTNEWKMNYDPIMTRRKLERYNLPIPASFGARNLEMMEWDKEFSERADFTNIKPIFGDEVLQQIDDAMFEEVKESLAQKELERKQLDQADHQRLVEDIEQNPELQLPELNWEPLTQWTQDEYAEIYQRSYSVSPHQSRDQLQTKIVKRFAQLGPTIAKFELAAGSTFAQAADQSDYAERMKFIENLLTAEKWDTGRIVNDDTFRRKQKKKIQSMFDPRDFSILKAPVDAIAAQIVHPDLYKKLNKYYFTFRRQNEFFYEWYSNYQEQMSLKKRSEMNKFYKFKAMHETMESREQEATYQKRKVLHPRHWDTLEQQNYLFKPTFTSLFDPENKLIPDREKFNQYYSWFMRQFDMPKRDFDPTWKLGNDPRDLESKFFFLHVDYEQDIGQAAIPGEDAHPHAIETKFSQLVYQSKQTEVIEIHDAAGRTLYRPFEYFEMKFDIANTFRGTEQLHIALAGALKRNKFEQYIRQRNLLQHRQQATKQKLDEHAQQIVELKRKYVEAEMKKPAQAPKSAESLIVPRWQRDEKYWDELDLDLMEAFANSFKPYTEDIYSPKPSEPSLLPEIEHRWSTAFEAPPAPPMDDLSYEYLQKLATKFESKYGISPEQQPSFSEALVPHDQTDQSFQPNSSRSAMPSAKSNALFVPAPICLEFDDLKSVEDGIQEVNQYQQDHKEAADEQALADCIFLTWMEQSYSNTKPRQLTVVDDLQVQIGDEELRSMKRLEQEAKEKRDRAKYHQVALRMVEQKSQQKRAVQAQQEQHEQKSTHGSKADQPRPTLQTEEDDRLSEQSDESDQLLDQNIPCFSPFHLAADRIVLPAKPASKTNSPEAKVQPSLAASQAPQTRTPSKYRPQMDDSTKVLDFVDKQVRKELFLAIKNGNIALLQNFVSQFGKSMTARAGQINYQSTSTGNTILHLSLLLDYDKKALPLDLEVEENNEPKAIAKALAGEGATSSQMKLEVAQILVEQAGANPTIQNRFGVDAFTIAENLKNPAIHKFLKDTNPEYQAGKGTGAAALLGKLIKR